MKSEILQQEFRYTTEYNDSPEVVERIKKQARVAMGSKLMEHLEKPENLGKAHVIAYLPAQTMDFPDDHPYRTDPYLRYLRYSLEINSPEIIKLLGELEESLGFEALNLDRAKEIIKQLKEHFGEFARVA